jgi:cyanophycinase
MSSVFLIGGGREAEGVAVSHAPFLEAAGRGPVACVMYDEDALEPARWAGNLAGAEVRPVVVSESRPLTQGDLAGAAAVYIAGGWTPGYAAACCVNDLAIDVPFAGFSAGAAIAADAALVGGWQLNGRPVCPDDAGEDLDEVTVARGLGLVPFAVEVHAAQWGTLTRLAHAVAAGLVSSGIAIDEHTCVEVVGGEAVAVRGVGAAHWMAGPGRLEVRASHQGTPAPRTTASAR